MDLKNIIFIFVFIFSFAFLAYSLRKAVKFLKTGLAEDRFNNIHERIKNVLGIAIGQSKILREPVAGLIHSLIFWGFLVFLFAVLEAIIQGFYSPFTFEFLGPVFTVITFVQDIFAVFVLVSVILALFRRFVLKVERLQVGSSGNLDAAFILMLIFIVVASMLGQNASLFAADGFVASEHEFRPVSEFIAGIIYSNGDNANLMFEVFWWIHIVVIFGFMNLLPYSKHFHVITSIPNVFLGKTGDRKYALKGMDLDDEDAEQFGAADVEHLTWKQLLDGYACTMCGRCTDSCPAANTGKPLSPRKIVVDIRKRLEEKAPLVLSGIEEGEVFEKQLVGNYITSDELWSCTTCMACVQECPVMIEHVDAIIDMRRNLTLMESDFPRELNAVFQNLETNFSPWAFNWQDRANWAEGLNIKTMAEDSDGEILFWVGCAGSFDARYQKVSKAFAGIMQKAGVDFRILGTEEKCNGDTARRLGNEYLAQMMIAENVETLNNYNVKKIVTACPHCFNTFKQDYPDFGGNFEVVHHSEFIAELLNSKKIELKNSAENKLDVTYHDSCYLGRYNDVYDAPRETLNKIDGITLKEMPRNKDKGFCCGAGGGRMFMEETLGTRINDNRTEEALALNPDTIASACPFCMTMLTDGVKTFDKQDNVEVKDIAEIIYENLK